MLKLMFRKYKHFKTICKVGLVGRMGREMFTNFGGKP